MCLGPASPFRVMGTSVQVAIAPDHWRQALAVLWSVYVGEGYSDPDRSERTYRRETLEGEGDLLVATRSGGEVTGALLFLHEGSRLRQVALPGEREFRLLAVRSDARGEGVGAALVQECLARAKAAGASGLVLWTRPAMLAAQRLYERLGMVRVPERDESDARGFTRLVYRRAFE